MANYVARPRLPDGSDKAGTDGTLRSNRGSVSSFARNTLQRYAKPNVAYNVYRIDAGGWTLLGVWCNQTWLDNQPQTSAS